MNSRPDLDTVLAPLAPVFRASLDLLLDLRENVCRAKNAGTCIAFYFDLCQAAGTDKLSDLQALGHWLEENIEIVAKDARGAHLEKLPLALHGATLEEFCQSIVNDFQEDRVYHTPSIGVTFQYKG